MLKQLDWPKRPRKNPSELFGQPNIRAVKDLRGGQSSVSETDQSTPAGVNHPQLKELGPQLSQTPIVAGGTLGLTVR